MITINYIRHFVEMHAVWAYIFIIIGVIIEGEIVVILAGIFAGLGSLNIFVSFLAAVAGGGIKSVFGYWFGAYLQRKHSGRPMLHQAENRVNYFFPRFKEKPFWSIFLSRFLILGLHWFSMVFSGYKKVKIRTYIEAEVSSLFTWAIAALALGYFFSYTALSVSRDVRKFIGIILLFFIAYFIVEKIVAFVIEISNTNRKKD